MSPVETFETTCWTIIQGAARGSPEAREEFALRYTPVVRAYLGARWGDSPLAAHLDDAAQDVFVECFKQGGVLDRADRVGLGSFRRFLYGVVRNVARRFEERTAVAREAPAPADFDFDALARREETLSKLFDRAWARSLVRDAVALMVEDAERDGEAGRRRIEILHLRFHDGLAVREIAERWGVAAATLHVDYARARREFKAALYRVVEFHNPGSPQDSQREFDELLAILS